MSGGLSLAALLLTAAVQQAPVERVVVEPARAEVEVDGTLRLTARLLDAGGAAVTGQDVRWQSLDGDVVVVEADGTVRGVAPGSTRVAALAGGVLGFADLVVPALPASELRAALPGSGPLAAGTSAPVHVRAVDRLGAAVAVRGVTFSIADPGVARVDATGRVFARAPGRTAVTVRAGGLETTVPVEVGDVAAAFVPELRPATASVRTGDVVRFSVGPGLHPGWTVSGSGASIEAEDGQGVFVAEEPGRFVVTALIGEGDVQQAVVEVAPREYESELVLLGRGPIGDHHSGDMWVFEGVDGRDYVYVGTFLHDWMKVWDVTDPSNPVLTDSLQLDARRINDVKIHPNNRLGIVTREGASSRRNGIVLLDLTTPAHPTILSEYTETVTGGVHNVWIDGERDLVYAAHNGTSSMHILDIGDPANPREVGRWAIDKQPRTLHDVIVQDGSAYLSYWDDGIVMLDVGAGSHGGTPTEPVEVSRFAYPIGSSHVAWRHGRYLFIGDELFPPGWDADRAIHARGYIHVVDYQDPENPVEVARYEVPEAGAHNVWVEGDRLYVGYYQAGLRVVDISGELRGDLYAQGREVAHILTTDENTTTPNWPMAWGPRSSRAASIRPTSTRESGSPSCGSGRRSSDMAAPPLATTYERGREALAEGRWDEARDRLMAVARALEPGDGGAPDPDDGLPLAAAAWDGIGLASYWLDDPQAAVDAHERAFRLYQSAGRPAQAARAAIWLTDHYLTFHGAPAVARGWLERAGRLLEGRALEPVHAWLEIYRGHYALMVEREAREARAHGVRALELARVTGSVEAEMVALSLEGLALVSTGDVRAGMPRLDEASAAAVSRELTDLNAAAWACCYLIHGCESVRDFQRAGQWCERVKDFCERWGLRPIFGSCRTHYASVLT